MDNVLERLRAHVDALEATIAEWKSIRDQKIAELQEENAKLKVRAESAECAARLNLETIQAMQENRRAS